MTNRALFLAGIFVLVACTPEAPLRNQRDVPRHRRGIDSSGPFLTFRGRAKQMGDLAQIAAKYRVIAIDADPAHKGFTPEDMATLRAGGRNVVLGILNVGYCDRRQVQWSRAPEGLIPCVSNLAAQIRERSALPQQVWMELDDYEYERLLVEWVAARLEKAGVDGFLLDGLELMDHGGDDDEAPCDADCVAGGVDFLTALRRDYPDTIFVMDGGVSQPVRDALLKVHPTDLLDGIVAENVYVPRYDAGKEAELTAWKNLGLRVGNQPFALITQDYVGSCDDLAQARESYQASRSHGFSPSVALSPVARQRICDWGP